MMLEQHNEEPFFITGESRGGADRCRVCVRTAVQCLHGASARRVEGYER